MSEPTSVTVGCCNYEDEEKIVLTIGSAYAVFDAKYARLVANNLFTCADHLDSLDRHTGEVAEK